MWVIALSFAMLFFCFVYKPAEARPKFSPVFEANYKTEYSGTNLNTHACNICHAQGYTRYLLNNYGDAITITTQNRDKKDVYVIRQALKDAEDMPSAVPGKTFGDLIRDGRLPASK
jgi:hypothetical protein